MAVHTQHHGHVRVLTIDRPDRRNALDHETLGLLRDGVTRDADDVRVLVLRGEGGHFCAGADLTGVEDTAFVGELRSLLLSLRDARFPTIAAVEGAALGAGTQLAVACDLRVADTTARFGIPAAKLGLMVDHWTVQRLALLAGQGMARAMLLAAEVVTGEQAYRLGLAQRHDSVAAALAWAEDIATKAPLTIAGHKVMLNALDPPLPDSPESAAAFEAAWASEDLQEGLAAFRERRPAEFRGR